MGTLKEQVAAVAEKLGLNQPLLARARRRYRSNRKRAFVAHNQQMKAQESADAARRAGHPALATKRDREAANHGHVAYANHIRAQHYLGVVKKLVQRIEGLEADKARYEAELKKLSNVTIKGNHAEGGTRRQRLKAVALASAAACASGSRRNFYSQAGAWDIDHCLTGESYGERSDCSSWVTSVYKSCGLSDPNGERYTGGYTGTLVAAGKLIPRSHLQPGDLIVYGGGTGHHVEMFCGPGDKTIGHGSAPVDAGTVDLFGDSDFRCYSYL